MTDTATRRASILRPWLAPLAVALTLAVGAARADIPDALDRVPGDAVAALVAPSLARLDKNVGALTAGMGGKPASVSAILATVGLAKGIATDKPFAVMLIEGDMQADAPPIIALAPVADYKAFIAGLGGKEENGMASLSLEGDAFFAKSIDGGYAAISPDKALLAAFKGDAGHIGAHAAAMGKSGAHVAASADAFLYFNAERLSQAMSGAGNPLGGLLKGAFSRVGLPIGGGTDLTKSGFMKDAVAGVLGLRAEAQGAHLDLAMSYKPGSAMGDALKPGGDSKALLKSVPADPFILAWALDTGNPGVKNLVKTAFGGGENGASNPALAALLDSTTGQAGVIFVNPQGLFDGLLSRGVYYYATPTADAAAEAFKKAVESTNNQMSGAMQWSTSYAAGAAQVDGQAVDSWSMKLMAPPGTPNPTAFIWGPAGGPTGYLARGKTGVVIATKEDPTLVSKTLAAADGKGALGDDATVKAVASALPGARSAEAYLGVKAVFDQVSPMLRMMSKTVDFKAPDTLPPIGLGLVAEGGSFRIDAYAPLESLKALRALANAMNAPPANAQPNGQKPAPADAKPGM